MEKDTMGGPFLRTSGTVHTSTTTIGKVHTYQAQSLAEASLPGGHASSGSFSSSLPPSLDPASSVATDANAVGVVPGLEMWAPS